MCEKLQRKRSSGSGGRTVFSAATLARSAFEIVLVGIEPAVQRQVQGGEVELPQELRAGPEGAGGGDLLEQLARQGRPGLVVAGEREQRRAVVAPVLHELARQLDGVPLDVVDAGRLRLVDVGQHVLQGVPELVEQGLDLAEGHQRRLPVDGRRLVADHVGHRPAHAAVGAPLAVEAGAHPGAAALVGGAAVGVQVEGGAGGAILLGHPEEADVRVPDLRLAVRRGDHHAEQPPRQPEQPLQHGRQREVGPQLLFPEGVALLAQALGPEGDVPQGQLEARVAGPRAGEGAQLLVLASRRAGGWPGAARPAAPSTAPTERAILRRRLSSA